MKLFYLTAGLALILGAAGANAASKLTGEARVTEIVAGRSAGAPVSCINQRDIRSTELIRDVGVIYHANNGTIYVNRPAGGVFSNGFDDFMVTNTYSGQLCRIDIVRLVNRNTRMTSGSFGLGDFVPYAKPRKDAVRG